MRHSTRRSLRWCVGLGVCASWLGTTAATHAEDWFVHGQDPRIVNGLATVEHPSTAALLYTVDGTAIDADNAGAWCSATLIGCRTVLTAAHCVEEDAKPSHYAVYLQHAGWFEVERIASHPAYAFPIADVAVLRLRDAVTGIAPMPLNQLGPVPTGTTGTIVGFGQTSGTGNDYAIKRAGRVRTTSCDPEAAGGTDAELICWDFDDPVGAPGEDSNTCNGDSGGPLFVDLGAGPVVAGVTSGGTAEACLQGDHAYDANVFTYRSFILGELGADPTSGCGGIPTVGGPDVQVAGFAGTLTRSAPTAMHAVTLADGAAALRVTLNGEDDGVFGVDLYVKQGGAATPTDFDCKADGASVFGACELPAPAAGPWSVLVQRTAGRGEYQVTATAVGGEPPVCGDGAVQLGEACDGADDAACPGQCATDCTCPAPVCGNGVLETGEECDGAVASACGGDLCDSDCTCPRSCFGNDLFARRVRADARRVVYRGRLFTDLGGYDGLDPRDGLSFALRQGGREVALTIPAGDPGWARSRPHRGVYLWRGARDGFRKVKLVDRSVRRGEWKVLVRGRDVPGAGTIDELDFIDITLTMDGVCTEEVF